MVFEAVAVLGVFAVDLLTGQVVARIGRRETSKEDGVAVGTDIADRPPRRSVRALLTHTALTPDARRQSARSGRDAPAGVE